MAESTAGDNSVPSGNGPITCPKCQGTGKNPNRMVVGRLSTASSAGNDNCPKCGGEGRLHPVRIEMKPASTKTEAQSG